MKELIKDILIALVIVVIITAVIKPTIVKESSMEPTLYENHYLFVNKMAYKMKEHPERGDIIVFESNLTKDNGQNKLLIKRVIAVEGDTVTIYQGRVYVNGELIDEPYLMTQGHTYDDEGLDVDGLVVPENQVFCMGDNREMSLDSRSPEVGTVPEDLIMGKAFFRLYPFDQIGKI